MRASVLPASLLRVACTVVALSIRALASSAETPAPDAALPDAPQPSLYAAPLAPSPRLAYAAFSLVSSVTPTPAPGQAQPTPPAKPTTRQLDSACQSSELRGKPCKLDWLPMLWEMFEATTVESVGNIATDSDTRNALMGHPFWDSYLECVHQYRYHQWTDYTPFLVHDIGHPMQGAAVYSIYEQNDPKSRGLLFAPNGRFWDGNFWRSRFKAMAVVTLYEIQWKIGPVSEASIGNSGYNTYPVPGLTHGQTTNETGFQDFVITPVYGLGWNLMEDLVDKHIMPHIWRRTHNKFLLTALLPLTPCRDAANWLRFKPAYYRDYPLTPLR